MLALVGCATQQMSIAQHGEFENLEADLCKSIAIKTQSDLIIIDMYTKFCSNKPSHTNPDCSKMMNQIEIFVNNNGLKPYNNCIKKGFPILEKTKIKELDDIVKDLHATLPTILRKIATTEENLVKSKQPTKTPPENVATSQLSSKETTSSSPTTSYLKSTVSSKKTIPQIENDSGIYIGPRGGIYHYSASGRKVYNSSKRRH
ncbi:hypothetical protein HUU62_15440 [Rhodoferax sp. 4810]|nr:hypothetical protein [Rhodoferax jenense]